MTKVVYKSSGVLVVRSDKSPFPDRIVDFLDAEFHPPTAPVIIAVLAETAAAKIAFRVLWAGFNGDWLIIWEVVANGDQ